MTAYPFILPASRSLELGQRAIFPAWIAEKKREARDLDPDGNAEKEAATAAAALASHVEMELLRFVREGELAPAVPFDPDTLEQAVDMVRTIVRIEIGRRPLAKSRDDATDELLGQLAHACMNFLEGWA